VLGQPSKFKMVLVSCKVEVVASKLRYALWTGGSEADAWQRRCHGTDYKIHTASTHVRQKKARIRNVRACHGPKGSSQWRNVSSGMESRQMGTRMTRLDF
jgi:hypothetical protein